MNNKITKVLSGKTILIVSVIIILSIILIYIVNLNFDSRSLKKAPKFKFTIPKKSSSFFNTPFGLIFKERDAFGPSKLYVADTGSGRIRIFDSDGNYLKSLILDRFKGSNQKSIYPVGVGVGDDGKIYVSEINSSYLYVFRSNGKFLTFFPDKNNKTLKKPVGINYSSGKLYVTDIGDHSVKVFNKKGKLLYKFGKEGSKLGDFRFPVGIAVSDNGNVYVADTGNKRVQVFSPKGGVKFAITGIAKEQFSLPRSIAIDSWGRVHIVDTAAGKVFVYNNKLKYLFSYGKIGTGKGRLDYPNAITADKKHQRIFITEQKNNRVSVWEY